MIGSEFESGLDPESRYNTQLNPFFIQQQTFDEIEVDVRRRKIHQHQRSINELDSAEDLSVQRHIWALHVGLAKRVEGIQCSYPVSLPQGVRSLWNFRFKP
ncbi:hypothetical protein RJ641_011049 [Dillenia turbinata]|uniref:Uncharacterized protein n=1 Tax=Dillenia turbinata TaxID=194707 RepID=A0AAN8UVN9_9MAGN